MSDNLKMFLMMNILFGFIIGAMDSGMQNGCEHKSIAGYHPIYYLSCELFKERF